MNKSNAILAILEELRRKKAELTETCVATREAANDAPTAMQSHSDTTRSEMQTQLADLEHMSEEIDKALAQVAAYANRKNNSPAELGSLVALAGDNETKWFLLSEFGGGVAAEVDSDKIVLVSPSAPLGQVLLHKNIGDSVAVGKSNCLIHEIQ